jgi:hypothetical protein
MSGADAARRSKSLAVASIARWSIILYAICPSTQPTTSSVATIARWWIFLCKTIPTTRWSTRLP